MAVPDGWTEQTVGSLLEHETPGFWGDAPDGHNDIVVVRATNLRRGSLRLDFSDVAVRAFPPNKRLQKALRCGDIVLERSGGGPQQPVGRVALFDGERECSLSNFMQLLRPRSDAADSRWLADALMHLHAVGVTERLQQATTGIRNLQYRDYLAHPLLVPPLAEQRKIAAILSSVDETIEKTEAVIEQLQVVKKAMMEELLTRGMPGRHTRFKQTEIGEVPEGWEVTTLGSVAGIVTGNTPSPNDARLWGGEYLFVTPGDLDDGRRTVERTARTLTDAGTRASRPFPARSVVFTCIGSTVGKVGLAVKAGCTNQQLNTVLPSERLSPSFAYYALVLARPRVLARTSTTAVPIINKTVFSETLIPVPPLDEQDAIAAQIDAVDDRIAEEVQVRERLRATKSALSAVLLTGDLRVTPDEAPP